MYQVWSYQWVDGYGKPIPERVLFGGEKFQSKGLAESAWYDTMPGRNDRAVFVREGICK